ncbi:hypothetical protein BJP36_21510 [Moorena producens JHB]|uniref:Uncharacterized protein n=1 Tax=Moorena producens (strain JHB) TaxID=1454205 RepID=A0A1D9G3A3_MOOP1|nr:MULTISPECIES: hypothetical protein [Moorena]AOY82098.1 hypothetical protein BJP36_21510 [Moorena producens JHB]NEQ08307.1 hypothetical protein [Moorena sp. SIO4E2]
MLIIPCQGVIYQGKLSAISYQLSAISYQLSAISYQLSAISYQLSVYELGHSVEASQRRSITASKPVPLTTDG